MKKIKSIKNMDQIKADGNVYAITQQDGAIYYYVTCATCGKPVKIGAKVGQLMIGVSTKQEISFCSNRCKQAHPDFHDPEYIVASTDKMYYVNEVQSYMWEKEDICEEIHGTVDTEQEFYEKFCEKYLEKYGEVFVFETENPQV